MAASSVSVWSRPKRLRAGYRSDALSGVAAADERRHTRRVIWGVETTMADKPAKVMVKRHSVVTRLAHWLNVVLIAVLLMSGLQIFNAHPALYWGQASTFADPWIAMTKEDIGDEPRGITT